MPTAQFRFFAKQGLVYDETKVVVCDGLLSLRRVPNPDSGWYRDGIYPEDPEEILLPVFAANGLTELYAFEEEVEIVDAEDPGTIRYRLSPDGGTAWLFWNGSAWAAASGDDDWNTEAEMDAHVGTFPFALERRLRLAVKLAASADRKACPSLKGAYLHTELRYNPHDDMLRSLKHFLEGARASLTYEEVLERTTSQVEISTPFDVAEVTGVYNLTDDPGRETDLYQSLSGKEVTMTAAQDNGDLIEIRFQGSFPVFLSVDQDYHDELGVYQIEEIPACIVEPTTTDERRDLSGYNPVVERNRSAYEGKKRRPPRRFETDLQITCAAERAVEATAIFRVVYTLLEEAGYIPSEATGERIQIFGLRPIQREIRSLRTGLKEKVLALSLLGKDWVEGAEIVKLVKTVRFAIGSTDKKFEEVEHAV